MKQSQSHPINTGAIQDLLTRARQLEASAERALQRAQEARDGAKGQREKLEQAFKDAARAVLG